MSASSDTQTSLDPYTNFNYDHRETVRTDNNPPVPRDRQLRFWVRAQREVQQFQHASTNYSQDLIRLVEDCLRYRQTERLGARRLLRRIRKLMVRHLGGFDTYGRNSRIPWNKRERLQGDLKDIWKVGTDTQYFNAV